MIVGVGVDLVVVARVEGVWLRHGQRFVARILHADEQPALAHPQPGRVLAKRFAVKEAAAKALGTGFRCGVSFTDFIYGHDALGKPVLRLSGEADRLARQKEISAWHVSVSDEKDHVVAMVVAERRGESRHGSSD